MIKKADEPQRKKTAQDRQAIREGDTLPDLAPAAISEETSETRMGSAQASLEVVLRDIAARNADSPMSKPLKSWALS